MFLGGTGGMMAVVGTAPGIGRAASLARGGQRDVLVHVFLRGGMDGLTTVVPYFEDPALYNARQNIAIRPPGEPDGAIDLDGSFGLAPAAAPLMTPYSNGHLAIVHAAGSTDPTRSHFESFQHMELGIPEQPLGTAFDGWLARHLQSVDPTGDGFLRAVGVNSVTPLTLAGAPATLPIRDLSEFDFPGNPNTLAERRAAVSAMYDGEPPPLGPAAVSSFGAIDLLNGIDFENYVPAGGAVYPQTEFGQQMLETAALIKSDNDVEAVMLELGGWDLHNQLGPINGAMAQLLDELTRSLEAFYLDMGTGMDCITVLVMSEFGRRVEENSSLGADHGHGNAILVMGGSHVAGGQVLRDPWPGLDPGDLDNGSLAITTDYRDVVSEILVKRMASPDVGFVFPNYSPPAIWPGVLM